MLAPLHNVIDREEHEKYTISMDTEDSFMTVGAPTIDKSQ